MKKVLGTFLGLFMLVTVLGLTASTASATNYYMANGGSFWTLVTGSLSSVSNEGYCVSGRGPCGSSLWYMNYSLSHNGCGYDNYARWDAASVQNFNGAVAGWIDSISGSMYGADYYVAYNSGSSSNPAVDQSPYFEDWAPIASGLYRIGNVTLDNGWGPGYICNGVGNKQVEFDEIRLVI